MRTFRNLLPALILFGAMLASPAIAGSADASTAYDDGMALLTKGAIKDALKAFATAAKADPENQTYRQQYALVRRIHKMRKRIDKERNPKKWETTAYALRSFYYDHETYGEALDLDKKIHQKLATSDSAALLAETQLNLDMNTETATLLGAIPAEEANVQSNMLLGIALARIGKTQEARAVVAKCELPENAGPGLLFDMARLYAAIGASDAAFKALTQCFESTPPSRLDAFKAYARKNVDLNTLATLDGYTTAMATASKVKESGCSGGSNCGSCPSRGKGCGSTSGDSSTASAKGHSGK